MSTHDLSSKERTERRAQYEDMAFAVCDDGEHVNVCNGSHNDDSSHTYTVTITDGRATSCTCPDHQYRERRCKHMAGTEATDAIMQAVSQHVATDGGVTTERHTTTTDATHDDSTTYEEYETTHGTTVVVESVTIPDTGDDHACYCPHCQERVTGDYNHRTGRRDCPQCCGGIVVMGAGDV